MIKRPDHMTVDELKAECKRHRDNLCDLEEIHDFTFGRTSVHIDAEKAQNLQAEFEEECKIYKQRIAEIEKVLQARSESQ
jgi:NAD/NADP transhydrogenase beta subunit